MSKEHFGSYKPFLEVLYTRKFENIQGKYISSLKRLPSFEKNMF